MRGLNDLTFSRQAAFGVAPLPFGSRWRNTLPSSTPTSQFSPAASRLRKSRSDSMLCWRNLCTVGVLSIVPACRPALADHLAHDVRDGHVLVGHAAAAALQPVRLVVGAHGDRRAVARELGLERDDLAGEHRGRAARLEVAEPDLQLVADEERRLGHALALGIGHADRRHVRQPAEVAHLDLLDVVHVLRVQRSALDLDRRGGDVLAGRHQSRRGRLSAAPRRRCSGLSMPLASATMRQRFGSP